MDLDDLLIKLADIGAVKFGQFTLNSGIRSPIYIDLRVIVSHPDIMQAIAVEQWKVVQRAEIPQPDFVCGVPYTALPIATVIAIQQSIPMLMVRREVKAHGTKRMIEGVYSKGDKCLVVEDLVTSGKSVLEAVEKLRTSELLVTDTVVVIDREQGGKNLLQQSGIKLHSITTISHLLDVLVAHKKIENSLAVEVRGWIAENQLESTAPPVDSRIPYEKRAEGCKNEVAKRLFRLMASKKSNLAVAADVSTSAELLKIANATGPYICCLKTHADIIEDWNAEVAEKLSEVAKEHNFLLFEDRKFADIGNTVSSQFTGGVHKIASWSEIVTAHALPGPGIISGLQKAVEGQEKGILILAEMSSKGNLATKEYIEKALEMANQKDEFVVGFISIDPASWPKKPSPEFIHMTPGVNLASKGDALGQQYNTPAIVIGERGSDVIIVGRGITQADEPAEAAKLYKDEGWKAYEEAL